VEKVEEWRKWNERRGKKLTSKRKGWRKGMVNRNEKREGK